MGLNKLAAMVDTWGWRKRYRDYRSGWPSQTSTDISFYETPKAQYRYRIAGQGQTIVFVADPPVSLEMYDNLVALYSRKYRVVIVEAAGMGFSAARRGYAFGFEESNDDLAIFLKDICGDQAVLAFSCISGLGAVYIANQYPALVKALFLIQTTDWIGFQDWKKAMDPKHRLVKPVLGQLGMKKQAHKVAQKWLKLAVGRKDRLDEFCSCAETGFKHGMLFTLASIFQNYLVGSPRILQPAQPMHLVWGLADGSHGRNSVERSLNLADKASVTECTALGHFPELENVEEVFQIFEEFQETL